MEDTFNWYIELDGKIWKRGYTTGVCAAAAAKAAILTMVKGEKVNEVIITTPKGIKLTITIEECSYIGKEVSCSVIKDAGDDPDVTHKAIIKTTVTLTDDGIIKIIGGEGVGIVTKPGLQVEVGDYAINPGPRALILKSVQEVLPLGKGALVKISVPDGRRLAQKTLNHVLGIVDGISILGTTGIVEPMSEEAFKNALVPQIEVALATGYRTLIFTPGKIGENIAKSYSLKSEQIILTSNFIGFMLNEAVRHGVKEVVLFGHIGKLIKLAGGIFYTHSKVADARMDIMAAQAAALGASQESVQKILESVTTEATFPIIQAENIEHIYEILAKRAAQRAMEYTKGSLRVGVVLVSMQGKILGVNEIAREIGRKESWKIS